MAGVQTFEEEFLTCGICMEIFTDPCTLSCGHSLCRKCLNSFLKTRPDGVQSGKIPCPFCRQATPVRNPSRPVEQWAGQIRPSLILQGLMDRHESEHKQRKGLDNCFLCKGVGETTLASSWCSDCEMTLCRRCAKMHLTGPVTKKHDVFDLSEGDTIKQKRKVKCKDHEGEQMKFICKDCKKAVCQTCCLLMHAKHNFVSVESIVPEIKAALGQKKEVLDKKMKRHMANVRKEKRKIEELNSTRSRTASQIKSDVNGAIALLREKEMKLLSKLDDASDRQIAEHQANVKSSQISTQMYQQHCEFIDQALHSESGIDMYDMYQVCMSDAVESEGGTESDIRNSPFEEELRFTLDMEPLKKAITEMGDITTSQRLYMFQKPMLHDTIVIKSKEDTQLFGPVIVRVLTIDGCKIIVVADYNNSCLKSLYVRKNKNEISRLKLPSKPICISTMDNTHLLAATVSDSQIIIASLKPEMILISTVKTNKQYGDIASLPISRLAAGSHHPPSVDILDLSGNVIKSFTSDNTSLYLIQNPRYLCKTREGNILVSDIGSKSVYCLTPEGRVVFAYAPKENRTLKDPTGITVTANGDILLTDSVPGKIIQLTSDGTFVRDVLTSTDGISKPWSPCVDDTNILYVCDGTGEHECIKVFSLM